MLARDHKEDCTAQSNYSMFVVNKRILKSITLVVRGNHATCSENDMLSLNPPTTCAVKVSAKNARRAPWNVQLSPPIDTLIPSQYNFLRFSTKGDRKAIIP